MNSRKTYLTSNPDDGEPTDHLARREYVASMTGFFYTHLNPKLESMLIHQHNALANPLNSRDEDLTIKGSINGISLIQDWGESLLSEHMENLKDPLPTEDPEDTA